MNSKFMPIKQHRFLVYLLGVIGLVIVCVYYFLLFDFNSFYYFLDGVSPNLDSGISFARGSYLWDDTHGGFFRGIHLLRIIISFFPYIGFSTAGIQHIITLSLLLL